MILSKPPNREPPPPRPDNSFSALDCRTDSALRLPTSPLARPHLARAIESRVQHTDQKLLAMPGRFLRRANVEFDARHAMQQADDPARTGPVLPMLPKPLEVAVCKDRALPTYNTPSASPHMRYTPGPDGSARKKSAPNRSTIAPRSRERDIPLAQRMGEGGRRPGEGCRGANQIPATAG